MKRMIGERPAFVVLMLTGQLAIGACTAESTDDDIETSASAVLGPTALIATATLERPTDFAPFSETLENGLPQNVLGGIGSGLTWAGGTTFLAVPDRGPNATPFNSCIDDTASYINRFQTLNLSFSLNPNPAGLPLLLTPTLQATTLLSSPSPLIYGTGAAGCADKPALPNGAPTL